MTWILTPDGLWGEKEQRAEFVLHEEISFLRMAVDSDPLDHYHLISPESDCWEEISDISLSRHQEAPSSSQDSHQDYEIGYLKTLGLDPEYLKTLRAWGQEYISSLTYADTPPVNYEISSPPSKTVGFTTTSSTPSPISFSISSETETGSIWSEEKSPRILTPDGLKEAIREISDI